MTAEELERYIKLYRRNVTDAALFIVKEPADAEDIAQDIFLKLYTFKGSFKDDEHVKAWLLRCAVNGSLNLVRSYRYKNSLSLDTVGMLPDRSPVPDIGVKNALMSLDPKLRAAIYMRYYEGYTAAETAKLLGISTAAVRWRLKRGRDRLRETLGYERS